jgi:hypothetical protein
MSANALLPRWPDVVWDAAVLRGIDARARAEIEAAGRLRSMSRGEIVYRTAASPRTLSSSSFRARASSPRCAAVKPTRP